MEKDIDEVGKIARSVKAKLEAMNKDVMLKYLFLHWKTFDSVVSILESFHVPTLLYCRI